MSIQINHITKQYGEQLALNDVTLTINKGIVGLLGPNGAGKSTLMKIITCFIPPSSGSVSVEGHDIIDNPMAVKRIVGYLPEHNPLYLDMYVREYLEFVAGVHQLKGEAAHKRINEMIDETGLGLEAHKKIGALSKGYRQRVGDEGRTVLAVLAAVMLLGKAEGRTDQLKIRPGVVFSDFFLDAQILLCDGVFFHARIHAISSRSGLSFTQGLQDARISQLHLFPGGIGINGDIVPAEVYLADAQLLKDPQADDDPPAGIGRFLRDLADDLLHDRDECAASRDLRGRLTVI